MLVRLLAAAVAACLVVPSIADACDNAVQWTTDDYVRVVVRAEKFLEVGHYVRARKALGRMQLPTPMLRERAANIRAVIALRIGDPKLDADALVAHFKLRTEAKKTASDVRHRAWFAEALVAANRPDEGRPILADLAARDLMPDAYGYFALAKLSTGAERYDFYKACRTRAAIKEMCELPVEVRKVAQARR